MQHLQGIWQATYDLWMEMGIYLIFGFAIAGILSRVIKSDMVARHLGGHSFSSVVKASLFGVPLPLCSCGVIPVGLSLYKRGASRGASTAFLISTPQTGIDSIIVTYGLLGPLGLIFAVIRPIAAFANGLLGGAVVNWFERRDNGDASTGSAEASGEACPVEKKEHLTIRQHIVKGFKYGFVEFPQDIAKWLVIGIVAAGVVAYLLPADGQFLSRYLGSGFVPMLVMAVAGIPFYICATASVPFVAVLVAGGLSPGAALVFLMTGPATNTATLILLSRELGKRSAIIYLLSIVVTSFAFGYMLDLWIKDVPAFEAGHSHEGAALWRTLGGLALLVIVLYAMYERIKSWFYFRGKEAAMSGPVTEVHVSGMTCENCARHVAQAAEKVNGVETASVDLNENLLKISGQNFDLESLHKAVSAAGYEVVEK
ncbi:MAG: SO_0444 family Cu/Zn efflux transporter [Candidatus Sumerlaeia bacterium]